MGGRKWERDQILGGQMGRECGTKGKVFEIIFFMHK